MLSFTEFVNDLANVCVQQIFLRDILYISDRKS